MRIVVWIAALLPAAYAAIRFGAPYHPAWLGEILMFAEGYLPLTLSRTPADPLKFLSDLSGTAALWLLAATLFITPLRAYLKINLFGYRRLAGLLSFGYALVHAMLFIGIDQQFDAAGVTHEVVTKPFIALGMGAFVIMALMALTSTKRLYPRFKGWHRLVYVAVVLIALHYLMSHKTVTLTHAAVAGSLFALLALRLLKR